MEKPLLVKRKELIDNIVDLFNNSALPLIIIEPILQDFLNDTRIRLKKEYEEENEAYQKYLKQKNK